jgi:cytolysin (calcineurin-like family phosphatase)
MTFGLVLIVLAAACSGSPPDETLAAAGPDDITFFITSDLHYGVSPTVAAANGLTVEAMNGLAGEPYPEAIGGRVAVPRGVVVLGDIVENGNAPEAARWWSEFAADYDPAGRGRLRFPAYEGVGNHDGDPGKPVREGVKARNPHRPGIRSISGNGLHYSWDWGPVHFVQLNLFPGSAGIDIINRWGKRFEGDWKLPGHSLEFLVEDLRENVGASGRTVVIFQHYGWDEWGRDWYSAREREAYAEALQGYRIAALFWGHSHEAMRIDWRGIPTFCVGSGQRNPEPGEFFVVRITPEALTVAERKAKGGWGLTDRIALR